MSTLILTPPPADTTVPVLDEPGPSDRDLEAAGQLLLVCA